MIRVFGLLCALTLCCLPAARGTVDAPPAHGPLTEVVVRLASPPLAGRTGTARSEAAAAITREQAGFVATLDRAVPGATVRWRYRLVLNGLAVVVPENAVSRLRDLPGVRSVDSGGAYRTAAAPARSAPARSTRWQTGLPNQGAGIKIGIIDDGVDQSHPFFSPARFVMPPGFPKGQRAYTTAKVIVARAFAPASTTWKYAHRPFDPEQSGHATHVAGIAAGDANTSASDGVRLSGVAPRAYIGNYKALSVPTDSGVGLNGNAPEIVAAIEAAVADGMDVINLSIGEPEIEPSRDIVALALDAAAEAGVVPVVAAGNDFEQFGRGSLISPGTSSRAITVAAVTGPDAATSKIADFSSSGPTPLSLRLKPDVSAPGVNILSSVPGGWETLSGTSMATPQISGTVALLRERHPAWTVAMVKSALIGSGSPVQVDSQPAPPTRSGGGLATPARADIPLILATPPSVSFGFVRPGVTVPVNIDLADEGGGGSGSWDVAVEVIAATPGASVVAAPTVTAPGVLALSAATTAAAVDGDLSGFVRLTKGTDVRRIPFWLHVARPALAAATTTPIGSPGLHNGDTRGKPSLVSRYRYPDVPAGGAVNPVLQGPEQVFRFSLKKPVANFGVVIVKRGSGSRVEPRVVVAGDENRLTGNAALPVNLNPYVPQFDAPVLAAGALRPRSGDYDVVFDSTAAGGAGSFTFRFWIDDVKPPSIAIAQLRLRRGVPIVVRVADAGSGVDPASLKVSIDGKKAPASLRSGVVHIPTGALSRARHRLRIQVSDYQETRNNENVLAILPNTQVLAKPIVIR